MTCHHKSLLEDITTKGRGRKTRVLRFIGKLHDRKEGDMFVIKERTKKKKSRQMKNHRTAVAKMDNCPTFNSE